MLTNLEPDRKPPPDDAVMIGRCRRCGVELEAPFSACKMIDDPPMGKVPCVACPTPLKSALPDICGTLVRMVFKEAT